MEPLRKSGPIPTKAEIDAWAAAQLAAYDRDGYPDGTKADTIAPWTPEQLAARRRSAKVREEGRTVSFVEIAAQLDARPSFADQNAVTGRLKAIPGPLVITDIGRQRSNLRSYYRALVDVTADRDAIGKETVWEVGRPGFWDALRPHLERQGAADVYADLMNLRPTHERPAEPPRQTDARTA